MVYVLLSLLGPGVAQGAADRRGVALGFVAAAVLAMILAAFTIYAVPLVVIILVASFVDAILMVVRGRAPPRMEGIQAAMAIGAFVVAAIVVRGFVAEPFKMPSSSMNPTLPIGSHIFINKLSKSPARGDIIVFRHPCEPERTYVKRVVAIAGDKIEQRCHVLFLNGKRIEATLVNANDTYTDYDEYEGASVREVSRYRETIGDHTFDFFQRRENDLGVDETMNFPRAFDPSCEQRTSGAFELEKPADPCAPHRPYIVPPGHVFTMGDNRDNSNDSRFWGPVPVGNIKGRVIGIWYPFGDFGTVK